MRKLLVLVLCAVAGCGGHDDPEHEHEHEHEEQADEHHHEAKWGGQLVELGDHFANVEVVPDPDEGLLTLYVLDAHAHQSVRLKEPALRVTLTADGREHVLECRAIADTLTGEKPGDSSQFEARSAVLKGLRTFRGEIAEIEVSGQVFRNVAFTYEEEEE